MAETDNNIAHIGSIEQAIRDKTREMARARSVPQPPPATQTTQDILNHILQTETDLRQQIDQLRNDFAHMKRERDDLQGTLDNETRRRIHYEAMLKQIAELVVNGARNGPPEAA